MSDQQLWSNKTGFSCSIKLAVQSGQWLIDSQIQQLPTKSNTKWPTRNFKSFGWWRLKVVSASKNCYPQTLKWLMLWCLEKTS